MSRKLGQVFLKNKSISKKIADYVLGLKGEYWMEIGPGFGALTDHVYDKISSSFCMVEIDASLIPALKNKFPDSKVICKDFLDVNENDLFGKTILFGNIPYYITSPIILKFLKINLFSEGVFMVQKEYYEVISSRNKTKTYSSMSVLVQSFVDLNRVLNVDRKQFFPIPKVDSSVVHMIKSRNFEIDVNEYAQFLRKCFHMPRKTLWNNLRKHFSKEILNELFLNKNINFNSRPEEKEFDFFVDLFKDLIFQTKKT